jgi:hypothetical protein
MNINKYTLLPALWQAMFPAEKRKAVDTGVWSAAKNY